MAGVKAEARTFHDTEGKDGTENGRPTSTLAFCKDDRRNWRSFTTRFGFVFVPETASYPTWAAPNAMPPCQTRSRRTRTPFESRISLAHHAPKLLLLCGNPVLSTDNPLFCASSKTIAMSIYGSTPPSSNIRGLLWWRASCPPIGVILFESHTCCDATQQLIEPGVEGILSGEAFLSAFLLAQVLLDDIFHLQSCLGLNLKLLNFGYGILDAVEHLATHKALEGALEILESLSPALKVIQVEVRVVEILLKVLCLLGNVAFCLVAKLQVHACSSPAAGFNTVQPCLSYKGAGKKGHQPLTHRKVGLDPDRHDGNLDGVGVEANVSKSPQRQGQEQVAGGGNSGHDAFVMVLGQAFSHRPGGTSDIQRALVHVDGCVASKCLQSPVASSKALGQLFQMLLVGDLSKFIQIVKHGTASISARQVEVKRGVNDLLSIGGKWAVLVLGRAQVLIGAGVVFEDIGDFVALVEVDKGSITSLNSNADRVDTGKFSALLEFLAVHVFALDVVVGERALNQRVAQASRNGVKQGSVLVGARVNVLLERFDRAAKGDQ